MTLDTGHRDHALPAPGYSAIDPARFEITYHRGRLRLEGHTASSGHEQQLAQIVRQSFPDARTVTSFEPLGVAPDHWATTTVLLLDALAATRSSSAVVTGSMLDIRGVAKDGWHERLRVLRETLPKSVDLIIDITVPDTQVDVADLCARAFAAHNPGPINFEESEKVFRSSAYAVLDRIVALADACRDSTISITGHTDSSGSEAWNRQLSLARANAVANYIAERSISRVRLIVAGAGSSLPVADNNTRYGRSLNRRIDINLRPGPPDPR